MADIEIRIDVRQMKLRQRELLLADKHLKKFIRREMKQLGKLVQRTWRGEFVGQMTDPETRRRDDDSPVLGRFSGKGQRAIQVRTKFPRGNRRNRRGTAWKTFVGPRGGLGKAGPGWHLALHEFGSVKHRRRPLADLARRMTAPTVQRELGGIIRKLLRGW